MEQLTENAKLADVVAKIHEIVDYINSQPVRDRGPKSERTMTEDDARRCMIGDLKDHSHKECAELLNLSYGQIYSARKGFTFKPIYKEWLESKKS